MNQRHTLVTLLDRAAGDPVFLRQLAKDPLGLAAAVGTELFTADLKHLLGVTGATDDELLEVLRLRVQRAQGSEGCGHCDDGPGSPEPSE